MEVSVLDFRLSAAHSYRPIPFLDTLRRLDDPARRRLLLGWVIASLVFIPSSMLTRVLDWTGIPIAIGGMEVFISLYVPLLFCTLCVMWLGYAWGAIPAYFSTLCVALLSGMPPLWAVLFSFANPVGLAVFALAYRAIPIRTDLRSLTAFAFFVLTAFIAAFVSSSGSFVWGYTVELGFRDLMPVWQGWWLGNFLQTVAINALVLVLADGFVARWKASQGLGQATGEILSRGRLLMAFCVVVFAVAGYVLLARHFSLLQLTDALTTLQALDAPLAGAVQSAFEGLTLVHWVTLLLIATTGVFGYQVVLRWTAALHASSDALAQLNSKLTDEIAERTRAEALLQENAAQLKRANDSKDRFFSIISHDLRSPLASLLSVSRALIEDFEDFDSDTLWEFVGLMHVSAENLYDLLDNLLTWSRLQTGGLMHRPEWMDFEALVQSVADLLGPNASEKDIELRIHVPAALHTWGDPNMLRSVILNLLTNAIKFTPPGGAVVLTVTEDGDRLGVEVRDTGVGMDEEQVGRLFRVDTTFSTPGTADEKGSGLGLILCHEMVTHHGSDLSVASRPGVGTTFAFSLPAHAPGIETGQGEVPVLAPIVLVGGPAATPQAASAT